MFGMAGSVGVAWSRWAHPAGWTGARRAGRIIDGELTIRREAVDGAAPGARRARDLSWRVLRRWRALRGIPRCHDSAFPNGLYDAWARASSW